jgi:hypothetical protein
LFCVLNTLRNSKAKKTIITETQKKTKNEQNEPHQKPGMKSGTAEG